MAQYIQPEKFAARIDIVKDGKPQTIPTYAVEDAQFLFDMIARDWQEQLGEQYFERDGSAFGTIAGDHNWNMEMVLL